MLLFRDKAPLILGVYFVPRMQNPVGIFHCPSLDVFFLVLPAKFLWQELSLSTPARKGRKCTTTGVQEERDTILVHMSKLLP